MYHTFLIVNKLVDLADHFTIFAALFKIRKRNYREQFIYVLRLSITNYLITKFYGFFMKYTIRISLYSIFCLLLYSSFSFAEGGKDESKGKGFNINEMDKSVDPGVDFYDYAVGNWIKTNPIPGDYSRWGSFEQLDESNNLVLKQLVESAASKNSMKGSLIQKIGVFYKTGMDSVKIEKDGIKPIAPIMMSIGRIENKKDLYNMIANFHLRIGNPFFNFFGEADAQNSSMVIGWLYQGGLGLPDRDYYLNPDSGSVKIRERYIKYVRRMFMFTGLEMQEALKNAETVMKIEKAMAEASMTRVELRDPVKTFNKMPVAKLIEIAPGFDWKYYFNAIGVSDPGEINVAQPEFFKKISQLMQDIPLNDWKIYLKWNLIRSSADYLSSNFVNEKFEFESKFLNGAKELPVRWKRVLNNENAYLGELLGQLYVKDHFTPAAKERAVNIVKNLISAMRERILAVDWMSDNTKAQALKKLDAFGVKIGYPDKWMDFTNYNVTDNSYYENVMEGTLFATKDNLSKIGKPVDKTKWEMTPQTVNAYYQPFKNEIVFPAGILQPPFYDPDADDAINYGAMGAVIGHEITHGFDDQGRQFDANGNIKEWWTPEDSKKFNERAKVIIAQYNSYAPVDTFKINGSLTQGENIADLGGLSVALTAFKKTDQYKNNTIIDGFTPEQRFFLSWAQIWRASIRKENQLLRLKVDPHSPSKYRVNGPLSNIPEFKKAFNIKDNSPMARPENERVKIW
jgi:putative endopeptidase